MTTNDIMSRAKAAADGVRTNLAAAHDLIAEARLPFIQRELEKRAHAMGCLAGVPWLQGRRHLDPPPLTARNQHGVVAVLVSHAHG